MSWEQILQLLGILAMIISAMGGALGITNYLKELLKFEGVAAQILAFVVQGLVATVMAILAGQLTPDMDIITILGIVVAIFLGTHQLYTVQKRQELKQAIEDTTGREVEMYN